MSDMVIIWRGGEVIEMTRAEAGMPEPVPPSQSDVRIEGGRRLAMLAATYSAEERETWGKQEDQARAYLADPDAPTPMLDGLLREGEDKAVLATYIVATADAMEATSAAILGAQRALMAMDPIPADYADNKWWPDA